MDVEILVWHEADEWMSASPGLMSASSSLANDMACTSLYRDELALALGNMIGGA